MNRLAIGVLAGPLLLQAISGLGPQPASSPAAQHPSSCKPSPTVLHAAPAPVPGLSPQQVKNATAIINAAAQLHVPEHGQTIAVMTALEASSLNPPAGRAPSTSSSDLFGQSARTPQGSRVDPTTSAQTFYGP